VFEHAFLSFPELSSITGPEGRYYDTPKGKLPSVTTVLSAMADKTWREEWLARVGDETAARITTQAQGRGRSVHNIAELYLRNDPAWAETVADDPFAGSAFSTVQQILDMSIGLIYGIEASVFSERLGTAGRLDLLCQWAGVPSIVDFKTSRRVRNEAMMHNYLIQATAYAVMVEEIHPPLNIRDIVVLVMPEHEKPQLVVQKKELYRGEMERLFGRYRRVVRGERDDADQDLWEKQKLPEGRTSGVPGVGRG
jgi:hypothetical protein